MYPDSAPLPEPSHIPPRTMLKNVNFSRPQFFILLVALTLVGIVAVIISLASQSETLLTGPGDIVLQKLTVDGAASIKQGQQQTTSASDMVLYGNGLLVCNVNGQLKSADYNSRQIASLVNKVKAAGLPRTTTNPDLGGGQGIVGATHIILNTVAGARHFTVSNAKADSRLTAIAKVLGQACGGAVRAVDPAKLPKAKQVKFTVQSGPSLSTITANLRRFVVSDALAATLTQYDEDVQYNDINAARAASGLNQLGRSACLTTLARNWAVWMGQHNFMAHTGYTVNAAYQQNYPNDASMNITGAEGYNATCGSNWSLLAENVGFRGPCPGGADNCSQALFNDGAGYDDGQSFMTSAEHRANILRTPLNLVGVGAYRDDRGQLWVTQSFAYCPGCSGGWTAAPSTVTSTSSSTYTPVVGAAANPTRTGYWTVRADGAVNTFGNVGFYGSMLGHALNKPIVGMASTATGNGYWLVAADGGIFPFGDAGGYGSTGNITLNKPIVGMAATPDGRGYWLVAADGGIFPFGDASGWGSLPGIGVNATDVIGILNFANGSGYMIVRSGNQGYSFGVGGTLASNIYALDALCSSVSIPYNPVAGISFQASVVITNTGGLTWSAGSANPERLGSQNPQDNTIWGTNRLYLNSTVATNQRYTFTGIFKAPSTPGSYPFDWQMISEGSTWFGQMCRNTITVIPDTTPPSAPANLSYSGVTATTATLNWTASTDNVGVSGYRVYQNGVQVGTVTGTTFSTAALTKHKSYSFYVTAYDAAGNVSAASATVTLNTPTH